MSRYRNPSKSVDGKGFAIPAGLSGSDLALRIAHTEGQEDGEVPHGYTRRYTETVDRTLPVVGTWHRKAECAKHPEIDMVGGSRFAKVLCRRCPVLRQCGEEAIALEGGSRDVMVGVRGGLTVKERQPYVRRERDRENVVYFAEHAGRIKIGTSREVHKRMATLGVTLLASEPGGYAREAQLHRRFADCHIAGEWFEPSDDLLDYIAGLTGRRTDAEAAA